jgi:hypothetical protein
VSLDSAEARTMNDHHDASENERKPPEPPADQFYSYDDEWRLSGVSRGPLTTMYTYSRVEPKVTVEHDRDERIFRLVGQDGKTEVFRDHATRYLVVEPDLETGEITPVIQQGQPWFLWLCREEHEVR